MWVKNLRIDKGREEYRDEVVPCLTLRASRLRKQWSVIVGTRKERRRKVLGDYPELGVADARRLAADEMEVAKKKDPQKETAAQIIDGPESTFESLCEEYIARMEAKGQPSAKDYRNDLLAGKKSFKAFLIQNGAWPIQARDVSVQHVTSWLREIGVEKPRWARKKRAHLNAVFKWGVTADNDWTRASPAKYGLRTNPVADTPVGPTYRPRT